MRDADRVLEKPASMPISAATMLLEVIDAQRKSAEVYLAYAQALVDHAHALITLEKTAGIWDVSF